MALTNKDKYLKDGVDVEEFIDSIGKYIKEDTGHVLFCVIRNFLKTEVKPILTDDEKAILRNINAFYIGRENGIGLYARFAVCDSQEEWKHPLNCLNDNLFQFIKPRRRI